MKRVKQVFIFGFRLKKNTDLDVKEFCLQQNLDYACAGESADDMGVVIGLTIPMDKVIQDDALGRGKIHPFSIEQFVEGYHFAREKLDAKRINEIKENLPNKCLDDLKPDIWSVSYVE